MPDPIEPSRTVETPADQQQSSAASSADETAPRGTGKPTFGPPAAPGEVGTLGRYRVVKQLGKGGMGAVYLAVDTRLDRKLALKIMLPEFAADRDAKERFLREARAAAKISHDNVVTVFEADERDGIPYIAMQFLQGYPLDEFLRQKGVPPLAHVIRIARETAVGLAAAHQLGLVHRDIKPGNLWLEAPNGRVKVLDFGLAKPVGTDAELTKSGAVVGSPAYMSPEQARGEKVDARTDLFSLGTVLYRLCTGQNPFDGPTVMAVLMALGTDDPIPVRQLNPNVPEPLARLVHQLLAKKPESRPQTAAEVAKRLRAIAEQILSPSAPAIVPGAGAAEVSVSQPVVVNPVPYQPPIVVPMQITVTPEDVFANLGDDEPTQSEPTDEPGHKSERRSERKPSSGKGALFAALGAVLLAGIAIAVVVSQMGKKGDPSAENKQPDGNTPADPGKGTKGSGTPRPSASKGADLPPVPAVEFKPVVAGASPFDKLDRTAIPKEERFDWQPKELVAVMGSHARRHWGQLLHDNFAFSPDGKWALTIGVNASHRDHFAVLYDVATGREVSRVRGEGPLAQMWGGAQFTPDSRSILFSVEDGVVIGRFEAGAWSFKRLNEQSKYHWPVVLADGKTLYLGSRDWSGFELWDIDGERFKRRKTVERGGAVLGTSADRKWVYLARDVAKDKPFELEAVALGRDDDSRKVVLTLPPGFSPRHFGGGSPGPAACVSPDGTTLAILHNGGWVADCSLYDLTADPPKEKAKFKFDGPPEGCIQFSADGKTLFRRYNTIHRTDVSVNPPRALPALPTHGSAGGCAVSPDGRTVIANVGTAVQFYDLSGDAPKERHPLPNALHAGLEDVRWSAPAVVQDRWLVGTAAYPKGIDTNLNVGRFWNLAGAAPQPWPNDSAFVGEPGTFLTVSPSGAHALLHRPGNPTRLAKWTPNGYEPAAETLGLELYRWHCSENGFALVPGAPPKLWHIEEPFDKAKPLPDLDATNLNHVAVRDDRALVATVNGTVLTLWNVTGEKARVVFSSPEPTTAASFTPDGKRLIAVGSGRARVYDLTGRTVTDAPVQPNFNTASWVSVTPDSRVAFFTTAGTIRAIDLATGTDVWQTTLPGPVHWLRVAPDGRHLFTHNANGTVYVLRLPDLSGAVDRKAAEWALSVGGTVTVVKAPDERNVTDAKLLPAGFFRLKSMTLNAPGDKVTDADLARFKGLTDLNFFHLGNAKVTDAGLAHLAGCTTITSLEWGGAAITGSGLVHLANCRDLVMVQFFSTPLTDEGLAHLKGATKMTHMNLSVTKLTDAALEHLAGMTELVHLNLTGTAVTDAGLERLTGLAKLNVLYLEGTKVTAAGVAKLAKALPKCKITWDGGTIEPAQK